MPRLAEALDGGGTYALGRAQVPTFTNPNNVAIVTGVSAARNGIAGNHYRDARRRGGPGHRPELPARARRSTRPPSAAGVGVLCVTAKDKLRALLAAGGVPAFSAELRARAGARRRHAGDRGRRRAQPRHLRLAALALHDRPRRRARARGSRRQLVYASLTDFVQHAAAPGRADGRRLLPRDRRLDRARARRRLRRRPRRRPRHARQVATPTAAPTSASSTRRSRAAGVRSGHTLCPITDPYVVHHAALGSLAWVHLDDLDELDRARGALAALPGVEAVLDRCAAAEAFELPADRIGDLIVLADGDTVLGKSRGRARPQRAARHAALARRPARARRADDRHAPACATGRCAGAICATATSTTCCSTSSPDRRRLAQPSHPVHSPYSGELVGEAPVASRAADRGDARRRRRATANELSRHERSQILFAVADGLAADASELRGADHRRVRALPQGHPPRGRACGRRLPLRRDRGAARRRRDRSPGDVSAARARPPRAHAARCRSGWSRRSRRSTTRSTRSRTSSRRRSRPARRSCSSRRRRRRSARSRCSR